MKSSLFNLKRFVGAFMLLDVFSCNATLTGHMAIHKWHVHFMSFIYTTGVVEILFCKFFVALNMCKGFKGLIKDVLCCMVNAFLKKSLVAIT